jgi:hypothetical protein
LLGDGWLVFGETSLPEDRVIEVSEHDAAQLLQRRGMSRKVEFLGWVQDPPTLERAEEHPT